MVKYYSHSFVDSYSRWFNGVRSLEIENADIAFLYCGEDINPKLYGQTRGEYTQFPNDYRDAVEKAVFKKAVQLGIPILGVCRGGQLATVLNGGKLIQHVEHSDQHIIITKNGESMKCPSDHHQQFDVRGLNNYELIAYAPNLSKVHLDGNNQDCGQDEREPEIIFFPETRSLCIQGRPECGNNEYVKFCQNLVSGLLFQKGPL